MIKYGSHLGALGAFMEVAGTGNDKDLADELKEMKLEKNESD